jgi:aminopeptidase N
MPFRRGWLAFAFALVLLAQMRAEEPFDFQSTPGKLPKHVVPQEYAIRIAPEISQRTFTGSVKINIEVRKPVRELVLNAVELQVTRASIDRKSLPKTALKLDPKQETLTIKLPPSGHARGKRGVLRRARGRHGSGADRTHLAPGSDR